MGSCLCDQHQRDSPDALNELAYNLDTPASVAFKDHEKTMLPEIKGVYIEYLKKKGDSVQKIEV